MNYEIYVLDLGSITLDSSVFVNRYNPGNPMKVPTFGHLIVGEDEVFLVDTSFSGADVLADRGITAERTDDQQLEAQLQKHGFELSDIDLILHTHLHIDHAGQDSLFPMNTPVVVSRRELEFSASGVMGKQYPADDIKHLIDRLHTEDSLVLLDLDTTGEEQIRPGLTCTHAGGHTDGSMNIIVETAEGTAVICTDVIYDLYHQVMEPAISANSGRISSKEPGPSGNHSTSLKQEKAAIKSVLDQADFLVLMHDRPAKIDGRGTVSGRLFDAVPGQVYPNDTVDLPEFKFDRGAAE